MKAISSQSVSGCRFAHVVRATLAVCYASWCAGGCAVSAFQHGRSRSFLLSNSPAGHDVASSFRGPHARRAFLPGSSLHLPELTRLHASTTSIEADRVVASTGEPREAVIQLEQSYPERVLEEGITVKSASRTFIDAAGSDIGTRQLCSGYLTEKQDEETKLWVYEAHISESHEEVDRELQLEGAMRVIDSLFLNFLLLESAAIRKDGVADECTFEIHIHAGEKETGRQPEEYLSIVKLAALDRGFRSSLNRPARQDDHVTVMTFDYNTGVRQYTESAFNNRDSPSGAASLEILSLLSARRAAFSFSNDCVDSDKISKYEQLLGPELSSEIISTFDEVVENGWLSTTPDSVDKDPTLHLVLVAKGKPVFVEHEPLGGKEEDEWWEAWMGSDRSKGELERYGSGLFSLVRPAIYDKLLPEVRALAGPNAEVCDIFMRRYADDVAVRSGSGGNETALVNRRSIAGHFDFDMFATSVVALDDVASKGRNGMYTTIRRSPVPSSAEQANRVSQSSGCGTSNHLALRRFFPLATGDAVMHDWSCLHGVDIEEGCQRTSLIVWFSDGPPVETDADFRPPWLERPNAEDDIGLFLGAGARAPKKSDRGASADVESDQYDPSIVMEEQKLKDESHGLYIQSASLGNTFALMVLGTLCMRGELGRDAVAKVVAMLEKMREDAVSFSSEEALQLQKHLRLPEFDLSLISKEDYMAMQSGPIARRLWLEAAMRGEAKAQAALGESLMEAAIDSLLLSREAGEGSEEEESGGGDVLSEDSGEEMLEMATVLFSLAAQQNHPWAADSLLKVLDAAYSLVYVEGGREGEFASSGVVSIAEASGASLKR